MAISLMIAKRYQAALKVLGKAPIATCGSSKAWNSPLDH